MIFKHKGQGVSCRVAIFNRAFVLKEQGLLLLTDLLETCLTATSMNISKQAAIIIRMITLNTFISCLFGLILVHTLNPHRLWTESKQHLIFMVGFISF